MDLLDTKVHKLIGDEGFDRLVAAFYQASLPMTSCGRCTRRRNCLRHSIDCAIFSSNASAAHSPIQKNAAIRAAHAARAFRHHPTSPRPLDRTDGVALAETNLPAEAVPPLRKFFHESATFMINRE